jgi:hypothetical protein
VNVPGLANPEGHGIKSKLGKIRHVAASHARQHLGWPMRPIRGTIAEAGESLIAPGVVKAKAHRCID